MQNQLRTYIKQNSHLVEKLIAHSEIIGLLLCLVGGVMVTQRMPWSSDFIIIGISVLTFVYAFHSNFLIEIFELKQRGSLVIALKISYLMLAVTMVGILFRLQNWSGGTTILMAGCGICGVLFLIFLYILFFGKSEDGQLRIIINNLIVRMLPVLLIVAFLVTIAIHG